MGTSPTHPSLPGLGQRGGTALLRLLADAVPVLLAYYEVPGLRCVFANQRYAQYSGMAVDALIGKTVRDAGMLLLHADYPMYGFDRHMGYPTAFHLQTLREHGPSPVHRRSYAPVAQLTLL